VVLHRNLLVKKEKLHYSSEPQNKTTKAAFACAEDMPLSCLLSFFLSFPHYRNRKPCANSSQQERGRRRSRNQSLIFAKREDALAVHGSERDGVGSPSALLLLVRNTPQHNRTIASERENTISFFSSSASSFDDEIRKSTLFVRLVVGSKLCEGRQQRKGIEEQML
jgi:hypothetical protein